MLFTRKGLMGSGMGVRVRKIVMKVKEAEEAIFFLFFKKNQYFL